jgi:hypothetical protein
MFEAVVLCARQLWMRFSGFGGNDYVCALACGVQSDREPDAAAGASNEQRFPF